MYIPKTFAEADPWTLFSFMDAHPLAAVVTGSGTAPLYASHLPLILDRESGPNGTLLGHFARANPHCAHLNGDPIDAIVIFSGPNAYITPEWYPTKHDTGKAVPTWNYVAVHAHGKLRLRDDPQFLRDHLEALTIRHEQHNAKPWHVGDAPAEYIAQQMKAIVCMELRITRLEGKWKMSQNRPAADIDGVVRGLGASEVDGDREVARIVSERRLAVPE